MHPLADQPGPGPTHLMTYYYVGLTESAPMHERTEYRIDHGTQPARHPFRRHQQLDLLPERVFAAQLFKSCNIAGRVTEPVDPVEIIVGKEALILRHIPIENALIQATLER